MTLDAEYYHNRPDILEERLSAYLDDMLDASERAELEAHLARCDTCQQQLAELRHVRALMRALPQPALPRSFLLPVEEAAGTATTSAESPATPVPLRATARRQRVARAAQWLGAIAAVLGLALLVSTAVLGTRGVTEATSSAAPTSGGATSAQSPTFNDQQGASPQTRVPATTTQPSATAADTATGNNPGKSQEGTQGSANAGPSQSHPSLLDLQLGGGTLLVAGVTLVVAGSVARRRRNVNQLPPPTTGN